MSLAAKSVSTLESTASGRRSAGGPVRSVVSTPARSRRWTPRSCSGWSDRRSGRPAGQARLGSSRVAVDGNAELPGRLVPEPVDDDVGGPLQVDRVGEPQPQVGARDSRLISQATAQDLGAVKSPPRRRRGPPGHGPRRREGRNAKLVEWAQAEQFRARRHHGGHELALRPPVDDRERAAADSKLEMLGKHALTEAGNEIGRLDNVSFDPQTGAIEMLLVGTREIPAGSLLGNGSHGVVLDAGQDRLPSQRRRRQGEAQRR